MGLFAKKALDFDMVTTKGGDGGKSSLYSGEFIFKNDIHFTVLGDLDELNSWLGVVRNAAGVKIRQTLIHDIQNCLYRIMSVVATSPTNAEMYATLKVIQEADVIGLEYLQKKLLAALEIQPAFIVPGEVNGLSANFDFARAITRRCERSMVDFIVQAGSAQSNAADLYLCQKYLNRLSDLLFVLARAAEL